MIKKIFNLLRFLFFYISDTLSLLRRPQVNTSAVKQLLIIRLDAIGDYILFRNMLEAIKSSEAYKEYEITLCGYILWKELSETFDGAFVKHSVWIERERFGSNTGYRKKIFAALNERHYDMVIQPTFSREFLYGDALVRSVVSKQKVGYAVDAKSTFSLRNLISDHYYTHLVAYSLKTLFEFDRNKAFIEEVLQVKVPFNKPSIKKELLLPNHTALEEVENYIVLFPGANYVFKRWSSQHFVTLATMLKAAYGERYTIVLAGSKADNAVAEEISSGLDFNIVNLCGKTSLVALCSVIVGCSTIVVGDTGALHIALALGCKGVCVANGNHFGRFVPYPKERAEAFSFLFPPQIDLENSTYELYAQKYNAKECTLDINTITPKRVFEALERNLS